MDNVDQIYIDFIDKLKSIDRKNITIFKNPFNKIPLWEKFVEHREDGEKKSALKMLGRDDLIIMFALDKNDEQLYEFFNGLEGFVYSVKKTFGNDSFNVGPSFIVSKSLEDSAPRHNDPGEVIHWNCVGKSSWTLWENHPEDDRPNDDDDHVNLILEEGDVIFLPDRIWHKVRSLTEKRAAITLATIYRK
jgi:hypothetical protein